MIKSSELIVKVAIFKKLREAGLDSNQSSILTKRIYKQSQYRDKDKKKKDESKVSKIIKALGLLGIGAGGGYLAHKNQSSIMDRFSDEGQGLTDLMNKARRLEQEKQKYISKVPGPNIPASSVA